MGKNEGFLAAASAAHASHPARCVACHGVRSHPVPVALVGECSIPVVENVARQPRSSY